MSTLEFIVSLLVSSGAAAVVGAAVVWLTKEYLSVRIKEQIKSEYDHRLESHRALIKAEYDQKLETHKAQLKAQSDIEIEKLKSQLSIAATERQVRFSHLHEKRGEVIAEVYAALREAINELSEYTKPFEPVGGTPRDVRRKNAMESVNTFTKLYLAKRIFVPEGAAKKLDQINDELKGAFLQFAYSVDLMRDQGSEHTKNWMKAWEKVENLSKTASP